MSRTAALGLMVLFAAAGCSRARGAAEPGSEPADAGAPEDAGVDVTFVPHTTCERLAVARCAFTHRCFPAFDRLSPDDCRLAETARCEAELAAIADAVRAGRASLSTSRLEGCLARFDAEPCAAALPPTAPAGMVRRALEECEPQTLFAGRVPEGEVCRLDQDCVDGTRCLQFSGACGGVCTPWTRIGELCGGACDPKTAFCSDQTGRCVPLAQAGESCKYPARCAQGLLCKDELCTVLPGEAAECHVLPDQLASCSDGFVCDVPPYVSGAGTCGGRGAAGAPCHYHWSCLPNLVCGALDWSTGALYAPGAGVCRPPRREGETCSYTPLATWLGDECAPGLTCGRSSSRCEPRPSEGERCQVEVQDCTGVGLVCAPDAKTGGRCSFAPGLGEVCRADVGEPLGSVELPCRDGFCDPDLNVCRAAWLAEGETCAFDAQCLTGRCVLLPTLQQVCGKRCP